MKFLIKQSVVSRQITLMLAILLSSLAIMQKSYAAETSVVLYDSYGYASFGQATSPGGIVYSNFIDAIRVNKGDIQYLKVEIPPGAVKAYVQTEARSWSGTGSALVPVASSGQTASLSGVALAGNTPPSGLLYDGGMIQAGTGTYGYVALQASSTSTFIYSRFTVVYTLDNTDAAVSAYNKWYLSHGGTTSEPVVTTPAPAPAPAPAPSTDESAFGDGDSGGTTNDSTTPAPTTSNPLLDLLNGNNNSASDEPAPEPEPEPESEFTGQNYIEGRNAIFEYLILTALENDGSTMTKIKGLVISANKVIIPLEAGEEFTASFKLESIPEVLNGIDESSVKFYFNSVNGIANRQVFGIEFTVNTVSVKVPLQPIVYQDEQFVKLVEGLGGVFKVVPSVDGWVIVVFNDGTSISLYLDSILMPIKESKASDSSGFSVGNPEDYGFESNDVNGDRINDIIAIHNGKAQLMLIRPNN